MRSRAIPLISTVLLNYISMTRKQKRVQLLFRKPEPADMRFETIIHILEDCGYKKVNVVGGHFHYMIDKAPNEIKAIPTEKGRKVGKNYFNKVRRNVMRFCPELRGGQR
ncbi:hypothetical protein CEE36_08460 [candidate division TA06 bacterium B3_TA06]|uniref:Toxin HicA n=1 Tax=candidate division TA06 bacterium B3_TA06 TaxID=2012487 RepID=A0A532V2W7_UNCT6|nr:MAG: hypothetical protein CEE36_08460 [candidate division TA06 bacterium B3_TA06]